MPFDHVAQRLRGHHLDLVAPLVEMPGHLEPARRVETHNQAAIGLRFQHLPRMGAKGKPPSLIAPKSLRIVREDDVSLS